MSKKKICNNIKPSGKKVKNTSNPNNNVESDLYKNKNMIIDFSFEGAFLSLEHADFNNYLMGKDDFIERFRKIMMDVQKLSSKTPMEIFNGNYRHCHKITKDKEEEKALKIIKKIFNEVEKYNFDQEVGSEEIFQLGLCSEVRLFGTRKGNVFKVYFLDYYHDFSYDEKYNLRNKKNCKFCALKTDL